MSELINSLRLVGHSRRSRVLAISICAALVVGAILISTHSRLTGFSGKFIFVGVTPIVYVLIILSLGRPGINRPKQTIAGYNNAREESRRFCDRCRYNLIGLVGIDPDRFLVRCPECGD